MILPGMRIAILMGWLTSVIILVKPWGTPKFKWTSLPFLLGFVYIPFFMLVNADLMYNYVKARSDNTTNSSKLDRVDDLVTTAIYFEVVISDVAMRMIFLFKARDLADLLSRLQQYLKSRGKPTRPTSYIDMVITLFVYVSTYTATGLEGLHAYRGGDGLSTIREYIGPIPHSVMMSALFYLPMLIPMKCAFSMIIAVTGYLSIIFEDYCQHVLDVISESKWQGMSILGVESELKMKDFVDRSKSVRSMNDDRRVLLLEEFYTVQKVFTLASGIISPMALVLLAGSSIAVVMTAYEVALIKTHWIFLIMNVCHLINYLCYFWILQSGQRAADVIAECKEKLEDKYIHLSEDTHQLERQTLKDILSVMKYWNWKFTACDFFTIDRGLASGVVSIIMTYVVVLVQLKVQDEPNSINSTESTQS